MTINRIPTQSYTGQGFKGERGLAIASIVLTIVSTLLLIGFNNETKKTFEKPNRKKIK
jgi:hypothetical protein